MTLDFLGDLRRTHDCGELRKHHAGQSADEERRHEPDRELHGCGKTDAPAPHRPDPVEVLHAGWHRDQHRQAREVRDFDGASGELDCHVRILDGVQVYRSTCKVVVVKNHARLERQV